MNDHNLRYPESSRKSEGLWPQFFIGAVGLGVVLSGLPAQASESQRDQIATLQGKMQAQQETVNHLKDQIDRQASASADLQRQVAQPPAVVQVIPPLYAYPPVGLGLYVGRPWIYGPPYHFYRPYVYGPRYYGHRHRGHRW